MKGSPHMRPSRIALLGFFLATAAVAQMRESITVSYVEVPVTVVDRSGNAVRGLTKANFEIVDEGKPWPIVGFEVADFAALSAAPGASPATPAYSPAAPQISPAALRNFLLVFDLSYSNPTSITRAKEAARTFVTKMVTSQDRIGVATVDVGKGFRLLTSFTTDRALVNAAIAKPANFRAVDPLQLSGQGMQKEVEDAMQQGGGGRAGGGPDPLAGASDEILEQRRADDSYNRHKLDIEVNLLAALSRVLRAVRGQKHLVLLSEGFDPRLVQGRDATLDRKTVEDTVAVERGELWRVDNDNRYGSSSSMSLVSKMAEVAKRCDVILDAVDIAGIRTNVDFREGVVHKSNEGLHLLANATGGTVFKNSNDLASDFQRLLKTEEVVYVLTFQAPASEAGKFHNIKVKLLDVPGGRAIARTGYYEAGGDEAAERTLTNAEIIVNDIRQDAVHVASLAVPFATSGDNAQVPVILEVNGADILTGATGETATLEIFTYAFDEGGIARDSVFQRVALNLGKVGATLRGSGVKYYATLSLPAGKYAVKSLVRVAESDRKGYARTDIVVPAKGQLAVSPAIFQDQGTQWLMIKGGSHDATNAPYPFMLDGQSFVPSAAVRLKSGAASRFVVFIRNAAPDELSVGTNPEAKLVAQLRGESGSKFVFELSAKPATSLLQVDVHRRADPHATVSSTTTLQ
jgi:VWFA-related protein